MPIYEYTCQTCQSHFDARRSMADADAPISCPECGGEKARRGLSLFATVGGHRSSPGGRSAGGSSCGSCSSHSCANCGH